MRINKIIILSFLIYISLFNFCNCQITIYNENFGSSSGIFPSGWTTTGVQGSTGWIANNSTSSSGYTGASGGANITTGSSTTTMTLNYSHNLSTIGLSNISVLWGARRTLNQTSPTFEWSADSITWNSVSFTDVNANSNWALVNGGIRISLPAGTSGCSNLRFRWSILVSNSGFPEYRIDDFSVMGNCTSSVFATSIIPLIDTVCIGNPETLNVNGGSLGAGAAWYWYTGSCGGTFVATGTSITVTPSSTTYYYCRAENYCNTTVCKTAIVIVHIYPPTPVITPSSSTTFCQGDSVILCSTTGFNIGYQWFVNSNTINNATSPSITVSTSGVYSIYAEYGYGYGFNCGVYSPTVTVTVIPLPVATITPQSATTFCQGDSVILISSQATGYSYQWMKNGSNLNGYTTPSFTADSTGYYFVNITNASSCSVTSPPVLVIVNPIPAALITTLTPTTFCPGDSVILYASLGSLCSYQWYKNGLILTGDTNTSLIVYSAGNYNIFIHDINCSNTSPVISTSLLINSIAADSISTLHSQICISSATTLNLSGGTLGTGANWHWYSGSCGGVPAGTGTSIILSPVATTTYFIRAEGTCNFTICVSKTITVSTVSTSASYSTASPPVICPGSPDTLNSYGGILGVGAIWRWYSGSCGGVFVGTGSTADVFPTISTFYFIRAEGFCNTSKCISTEIVVNSVSTVANSVSMNPSSICSGFVAVLSVSGGILGTGANWCWYSGSCGGTIEGTGISININPISNNLYFVRAEGTCNSTSCISIFVIMDTVSVSAFSAISSPSVFCAGTTSTLNISGGFLGTGANWFWFSGACGGIVEGTGQIIYITPTLNTSYFVRAEGICNTTVCVSTQVIVNTNSAPANSLTGSSLNICSGSTVTLGISGGTLGTGANWFWYSNTCGGIIEGYGVSLNIIPSITTTYFVRAEGNCNTTMCSSITIVLNSSSLPADSAISSPLILCSGATATLSLSGGNLGLNSNWHWYTGICGGVTIGTGASITVNPTITNIYFARAEGLCNTTLCVSTAVIISSISINPDSIYSLPSVICSGATAVLNLTGGSLGLGAGWFWYSGTCGGISIGSGSTINISPTINTTYYLRASGTCNTTSCLSTTITMSSISFSPDSLSATIINLCTGSSTTINVSGGALGTNASWQWHSGSCGNTIIGTGSFIYVSPVSSTTYFVNASGTCNTTTCKSIRISVFQGSIPADSAIAIPNTICSGSLVTLHLYGGISGTGAVWYWYSGSCGGNLKGSGTIIILSPTSTTNYFIRAEGSCNTTTCKSLSVNVNSNSVLCSLIPVFSTLCIGSTDVIHTSGGSLGTNATWYWYEGSCSGTVIQTGNSINIIPTITSSYYIKAIGTCNTTGCSSCVITVDTLPNLSGGIMGAQNVFQGSQETYSVTDIPGTSYLWTAPTGWTGNSTSNSISYICSSTGWITVTPSNTCGTGNVLSLFVVVLPLDIQNNKYNNEFIFQNNPNPFNNFTKIEFELPEPMSVRIDLYDINGQYITKITDKFFLKGKQIIIFNASNLKTGVYLYKIILSGINKQYTKIKIMNIVK